MCYLLILMTLRLEHASFLYDANGIFYEIKTAFSEQNMQKRMTNVAFLASDDISVTK